MGIRFDDAAAIPHRAPPRLGADGAAALADWLGYDAAAVAALRAQAII
jgi:crotonobetainyl-CoA:carnitine CoA-transferase CaiB-like acyl-CoA transferase